MRARASCIRAWRFYYIIFLFVMTLILYCAYMFMRRMITISAYCVYTVCRTPRDVSRCPENRTRYA